MVDLNHVLSNYDFVKVEEIVNHENAEPLTFYDIEVEDDHTFHIQFNDQYILSHNCDGHHICGLLCNLFGALWPDLMQQNILYRLKTPAIVAKTPKESFEFFNLDEYHEWEKKGIKHTPKYFKGLSLYLLSFLPLCFANLSGYAKRSKILKLSSSISFTFLFIVSILFNLL